MAGNPAILPLVRPGAPRPESAPQDDDQTDDRACAQTYGRLTEGMHLAGYSFERACANLEWLLQGDRWQRCGTFADVNAFLDSVRLDQFRAVAEQRKRIAARIKELQPEASNRQIGRTLGVGEATVRRDTAPNGADTAKNPSESTPSEEPPASNDAPAALSGAEVASLARREEERLAEGGGPRPDEAAQRGQPSREGPDFWPTPPCLTAALVRFVLPQLPPGPIWECAAGDGRLVRAMRAAGRSVTASDLHPQDGSAPLDFLTGAAPTGHAVVTNPPFNQTDAFLARGLELLDAGAIPALVLLLRHDHLTAAGRVAALNRAVREIHCNWRPIWIADSEGNPRWAFHWFVWGGGQRQAPLYLTEEQATKGAT